MVNDQTAEPGDEEPSNQILSEENQAKLKEVFSWLQKYTRDQVRDVDHFEEILESIDQELLEDIKASLGPISDLEIHYVAIRRALKSQSSRPDLEQKKARAEQALKGSQAQIDSNKELLVKLQSALELKIARKAALEIELKNLSAEIEADEKKIAELEWEDQLKQLLATIDGISLRLTSNPIQLLILTIIALQLRSPRRRA
jgi:chromosome segregation ATPase